jgi:hypothetical protein
LQPFVIEESTTEKYKKDIEEEVNDIGYDTVNLFDNPNTLVNKKSESPELIKYFKDLYGKSFGNAEKMCDDGKYSLHSVIVHSGSTSGGHYHTYVRKWNVKFSSSTSSSSSSSSSVWYHFDDVKVTEVSFEKYEDASLYLFILFICVFRMGEDAFGISQSQIEETKKKLGM